MHDGVAFHFNPDDFEANDEEAPDTFVRKYEGLELAALRTSLDSLQQVLCEHLYFGRPLAERLQVVSEIDNKEMEVFVSSVPFDEPRDYETIFEIEQSPCKLKNIPPKCSVRKVFTLLGHFLIFRKISKHIFKPCSHIEFNTTNPNTISKITS